MPDEKPDMSDKTRNVEYQVDTTSNLKTNIGAYFSPDRNSLTINYKRDNPNWNNWSEGDAILGHEQKHRDNAAKGMHAWPVSPQQAYKLNMHDEISANIVELLTLRQKYLETGDISVFDDKGSSFHFYKDAIINGDIDPHSQYQEDFDKEMSLIVNGTQKMWQEKFAEKYIDAGVSNAISCGDWLGTYAKYYDQNYQKALKVAYNIGGVDFTKYIEKDVEIPQSFAKKVLDIVTPSEASLLGFSQLISRKNKQTNPVNTDRPEYRTWKNKDGHRVSEVQHRQILDMNKDIIEKPTKLYAEEQISSESTGTTTENLLAQQRRSEELSDEDTKEQLKKDSQRAKWNPIKLPLYIGGKTEDNESTPSFNWGAKNNSRD